MKYTDEQITKLQEFTKDSKAASTLLKEILNYPEGNQFILINARITAATIGCSVSESLPLMVVKSALILTRI